MSSSQTYYCMFLDSDHANRVVGVTNTNATTEVELIDWICDNIESLGSVPCWEGKTNDEIREQIRRESPHETIAMLQSTSFDPVLFIKPLEPKSLEMRLEKEPKVIPPLPITNSV